MAVGTNPDVIVDHYLASNGQGLSGRTDWATPELRELLDPFVKVLPDYVEAQMDAVETDWGGVDALYAQGYGLGSGRVELLREELLEPR
jgi:protein-tyrosine phosphatase